MSASVFSLPIPLVLLIHLHILEYPHANKPEYDHNVFEPRVRGLKERTKLLEDVSYFLVGRIEGNARTVLATYPCLTPSDTLAFRTSLSKHLEAIRHTAVYPTLKVPSGNASAKSKGKETPKAPNPVAWWWKDIVVRKSLLEECAGERFERLLLSVSTHALMKGSSLLSTRIKFENLNAILGEQPTVYAELLRKCRSARHAWVQSASVILQREADLRVLRARLRSPDGEVVSNYSALSTDRFITLVTTKSQDLLHTFWSGPNGETALGFLAKAVGIERPIISKGQAEDVLTTSLLLDVHPRQNCPAAPSQPLPIAAAHHPAYLKRFRKPVFSTAKREQMDSATSTPSEIKPSHRAALALSEQYDTEARTQQTLKDTLAKIKAVSRDLSERAKALERKRQAKPPPRKITKWSLDLWEPEVTSPVDFETKPTPELLASFSLDTNEEGGLEARIDEIRDTLLPAYPPLPNLAAPRVPHSEPFRTTSKIPRGGLAPQKASALVIKSTTSKPAAYIRPSHIGKGVEQNEKKKGKAGAQKPKKSIRMSLAAQAQCRSSLFATIDTDDDENPFEVDVRQMIHGVQDTSTEMDDFEDAGVLYLSTSTPKALKTPRTTRVNRIFTGTRTLGGSTIRRPPKQSFPVVFQEPAVPLPSLMAASESFHGTLEDGMRENDGDEEHVGDTSMTLKDILLRSDTTDFGLLYEGERVDRFGDESFGWE